jgi:hypothetical protein
MYLLLLDVYKGICLLELVLSIIFTATYIKIYCSIVINADGS